MLCVTLERMSNSCEMSGSAGAIMLELSGERNV